MAKTLLIQAAIHNEHVEVSPPLGLMSIASAAREAGSHDMAIFDMRPPDSTFDQALAALDDYAPDVVGLSAQSPDAPVMHRLASRIRERRSDIPIVCGGVHATAYWQDVMDHNAAIDYILPGDGELAFAGLLQILDGKGDPGELPGLARREDGKVVRSGDPGSIQDLDALPHPAWDLVDPGRYADLPRIGLIYQAKRYMIVETARGCPFQCAWCHKTMGSVYRTHSPGYVLEQIEILIKEHGIGEIAIIDDLFNLDEERVNAIFSGIVDRNLRIAICIPNGIRADRLSDKTLALMKKAGVYRLMFAVETSSPRLQGLMRKRMDFEKLERAIRTADGLGMLIHGNFIIGLPTENEEEVRETIRYAVRSRLDTVGVYRAIPFKGSDLYRIARDEGVSVPDGEATLSFWDPEVNLSRAPTAFLNRMKKEAYRRFYLRPDRIARVLRKLPNRLRMLPFLVWFFLRKSLGDR